MLERGSDAVVRARPAALVGPDGSMREGPAGEALGRMLDERLGS